MGYYADFESAQGTEICTNSAWWDFTDYAEENGGDCLRHLIAHGWEDDLDGLLNDLNDLATISTGDNLSVIQDLIEQVEDHKDEGFIVITDGSGSEDSDDEEDSDEDEKDTEEESSNDEEPENQEQETETSQHDETGKSELEKLREFVEKGRQASIQNIANLSKKLQTLKPLDLDINTLAGVMEQEIRGLRPQLEQDFTTSMFSSAILGLNQTAAQVPFDIPSIPFAEPTRLTDDLASLLFPGGMPPRAVMPVLEAASKALQATPAAAGSNYKQTAQLVREGAFAVTGDLTEHAVEDVRNELNKALQEGLSQKEFIDVVSKRLEESGSPLAPNHLESVFRTNIMSAMSDAQNEAVKSPMVADAFPYAAYSATHDARVRPEHLALEEHGLNGTNIYRIDDPVFQKFRPPCDYNCRCTWTPTSVEGAAARGVQEAREWMNKALHLANTHGGSIYQYLNDAAPDTKQFVEHPPFNPSPEFQRDVQLEESKAMIPYPKHQHIIQQVARPVANSGFSFGELANAALEGLGASIGAHLGEHLSEALGETLGKSISQSLQQTNINLNMPPTVVQMAEQPAPNIVVNVPEQPAPIVNVAAPEVHVAAPVVNVNVPEQKPQKISVERDEDGNIIGLNKE